jgi:hypothetical protein
MYVSIRSYHELTRWLLFAFSFVFLFAALIHLHLDVLDPDVIGKSCLLCKKATVTVMIMGM